MTENINGATRAGEAPPKTQDKSTTTDGRSQALCSFSSSECDEQHRPIQVHHPSAQWSQASTSSTFRIINSRPWLRITSSNPDPSFHHLSRRLEPYRILSCIALPRPTTTVRSARDPSRLFALLHLPSPERASKGPREPPKSATRWEAPPLSTERRCS